MSGRHFTSGLLLAGSCLAGVGCESYTARGAGIGAGVGALGGAIIGHQSGHAGEGALIGGLGGAVIGGAAGAYQDDRDRHYRESRAYEYGYHQGRRSAPPRPHHNYGYRRYDDPYCR